MKISAPLSRFVWLAGSAAAFFCLTACGGGGSTAVTSPAVPPPPPQPPATLVVTTSTLPSGTLGMAYSQSVVASGGVPPYSWAVSSGSLPAGLSLTSSSGLISGTMGGVQTGAAGFSVTVTDSQAVAKTAQANLSITAVSPIQHVVIIFQENRSTDNLFQDPVLIANGADIQSYGINSLGQKITLSPMDLGTSGSNPNNYDISHAHKAFLQMCDLNATTNSCAMDGADLTLVTCNSGAPNCPPANPQFMYVSPADVQPYFDMAEQYAFSDRMFQTNQGPSFPAHQFIISGTSEPQTGSDQFVENNPQGVPNAGSNTGCTSPMQEYVNQIDPSGIETDIYPCFEHQTLTDLLEAANFTWRYYAPTAGSIWNAPNAIQHLCGPDMPPPNATACVGTEWTQHVVLEPPGQTAQVLTDVSNGNLATVSWVIPQGMESDHPSSNDGTGPSWVASVVNAIGSSTYWSNTAIIIAWDDWGGWYDHVAPPMLNSYEYGFRVPMIVMSPYAKPAYISHVTHDFGSILKFMEATYNLPSLGYADFPADDLADCFNFSQAPIVFQTINAPLKAEFFLHDMRPPVDPDND